MNKKARLCTKKDTRQRHGVAFHAEQAVILYEFKAYLKNAIRQQELHPVTLHLHKAGNNHRQLYQSLMTDDPTSGYQGHKS